MRLLRKHKIWLMVYILNLCTVVHGSWHYLNAAVSSFKVLYSCAVGSATGVAVRSDIGLAASSVAEVAAGSAIGVADGTAIGMATHDVNRVLASFCLVFLLVSAVVFVSR